LNKVLNGLKQALRAWYSRIDMKNLRPLTYFFGFKVTHSINGLSHQQKYTEDLINLANLIDNKTCANLMELNLKLKHDDEQPIFYRNLYKHLKGNLVYHILTYRDMSFIVYPMSFFYDLCRLDLTALHHIIIHFKGIYGRVYSFLQILLLYLMLLHVQIMLVI
jgi:hypothetical protein